MSDARYFYTLMRSLFRTERPRARTGRAFRPLLALLVLTASAWTVQSSAVGTHRDVPDRVGLLLERVDRTVEHLQYVEDLYESEVAPLERVLLSQQPDVRLARRVATALSAQSRRADIDVRLLLAVMLVENPDIKTNARSPVGAQGLMQVMPFHRGAWQPCPARLDDIESNICHGARIFAHYLERESGNVERALLRYNGCVRGTNTPDCHTYPAQVLARAGRVTIHDWRSRVLGAAGTRS
jgi:hypothetical protein